MIDEEPYCWLLLEEDGRLYLDAFCSHSAVDYLFLIALNEEELRLFKAEGRAYLTRLASDIHNSAAAVRGSRSPYKARGLTPTLGDRVDLAWERWRRRPDAGTS